MIGWHTSKNGRPSMAAAITSAVLDTLQVVAKIKEASNSIESFRANAVRCIQECIDLRQQSLTRIAAEFVRHINSSSTNHTLLTFSASSTIKKCLLDLATSPDTGALTLLIPESRPLFEGVSFAGSIVSELRKQEDSEFLQKLNVEITTDASMGQLVKRAKYVLLGADRISSDGDVSNKAGSLPIALSAHTVPHRPKVLVISELDKVAPRGPIEEHPEEEASPSEVTRTWSLDEKLRESLLDSKQVKVRNSYFEWVPARYIDGYVTEEGVIGTDQIRERSQHIMELEEKIFEGL